MQALMRVLRWLLPPRHENAKGFYTLEQCEVIRMQWYRIGLTEGELVGRLKLSEELQREFAPEGRRKFTAEDAANLKRRQVH